MLINILLSGLPFVPLYIAIYLVFLLRNDFDLTVEGSFASGGAVASELLIHGQPVFVAMVAAMLVGGLFGFITATIHARLKIPVFLAGLIMSIGLYSINLRIMGKQPTLSLSGSKTIFSGISTLGEPGLDWAMIGIISAVVSVALSALALFLKTEPGLALRTAGSNASMSRSNGVNDKFMVGAALMIANALAALGGTLVVQTQGYVDVAMGQGVLIGGLGAVTIGALFVRPSASKIGRVVLAVVIGAIAYNAVLVVALRIGLDPADLSLVTAMTLILAITAFMISRRVSGASKRSAQIELFKASTGTDLLKAISSVGGK